MKKIILILSILFISVGCSEKNKINDSDNKDAIKFKEEYEKLNKTKNSDGLEYLELDISVKNPIKYKDEYEIVNIINHETGIIYFGYPECPWCRNAIMVLLEAAKQTGVKDIYYLNVHDIRDKKKMDNGKLITEYEGTEGYRKILEALGNNASVYAGLENEESRRIYVPLVVFVKNGKIIDTIEGTVDSQKDPYVKLNEDQTKELLKKYKENIHKIQDDLCDKSC